MVRSLLMVLLSAAPLLAAPVPPEEKPKSRAKLLGTVKLNSYVTQVCWTPEAKHLIVVTGEKGLVIDRDQLGEEAPAKPISEFALPVGRAGKFGVTPDGTELYAMVPAGRFNSETRLCYWTLKDLLEGKKKAKPDRAVSLEVDNPNHFTFSADGRSLYVVVREPRGGTVLQPNRQPQQIGKVVRLSTKTGDIAEEWISLDLPNATLLGAEIHPESGKVFAHFQSPEEHIVRCFDRPGKKEKWERTFTEPSPNSNVGSPMVSPDGNLVVASWSRQYMTPRPGVIPQPGQRVELVAVNTVKPQLLNATTGDVIADLVGDDVQNGQVICFSSDSKLMFGWQYQNSRTQYVVWETKSGKPIKTWNRVSSDTRDMLATFAPGRHELAVVERSAIHVRESLPKTVIFEPNGIPSTSRQPLQPQVLRIDHTAVIGIWDLAPLVK